MAGPALMRWITWTRTKKLKTRPPTNEGDDGEEDSSGDEEPTPEVDGDEHQAKQQACWARLSALEGNEVTVCVLPPPATSHQPSLD